MNFDLSPESRDIRDLCRKVGAERLRPQAFDRRDDWSPREENLRLLGSLGLLGICLPEAYGGGGRPELDAIVVIEELGYACPITGELAPMILTGPASFIAKFGTEYQKRTYIPPVCQGLERFAISLTEPEAGTALTDMKTSARIEGDRCIVNGQKIFCSGGSHAHHVLVFVRFGPGTSNIGAVIVHRDTPGFTMSGPHQHLSGAPWNELYFEDAEISVQDVLFEGDAMRALLATYSLERCGAAAYVLGVARIAFDAAVAYSEDRRQFGRPISDFQFIQGKLADMYIAMESARLLTYRAIAGADNGLPSRIDSSAAKVAATEAASMICNDAMQIHGGSGMSRE
ncbi:MAG TPA: acyl-CoA dehydrogenase family protein, partial [Solirubrobacteraceae bacterium]|nr:acyl-CoA dehydrogenase family protein [Solirubrobacteraceae bacterium]